MKVITEEIKQQIVSLYEEGKMDSEIAKLTGIKRSTILWFRKKHNLPTTFTYSKISKIQENDLIPLVNQGLSDYKIAKILNVNARSVHSYRKAHNIVRDVDLRFSTAVEPTVFQKQVLLGTLLGDASLHKRKENHNTSFSCAHGIKQKDYAHHLNTILQSLGAKCHYHKRHMPDKRNGNIYEDYTTFLPCNPALNQWYYAFYRNGKKRIPFELFEYFTEVSLAFLFMDNGSKLSTGYMLATDSFTYDELQQFQDILLQKFNIYTTIQKHNHIYIKTKSAKHFQTLIEPYVIDCMKYKFHVS